MDPQPRSAARLERCRDKAKNSPTNATDATTATVNTCRDADGRPDPPYGSHGDVRHRKSGEIGEAWLWRCHKCCLSANLKEGFGRDVTTKIWDFTYLASKQDLNQPANIVDCCYKSHIWQNPFCCHIHFYPLFCIPGIHLDLLSLLVIHLEIWWFESMHSRDPFGNPVLEFEIKVSTL